MRKSGSAPNLVSLGSKPSIVLNPSSATMRRCISTSAFEGFSGLAATTTPYIQKFVEEVQVESVLHIPSHVSLQCSVLQTFPNILDPKKMVSLDEKALDVATCVAMPIESTDEHGYVEIRNTHQIWQNTECVELMEKYGKYLRGVRRGRRRKN